MAKFTTNLLIYLISQFLTVLSISIASAQFQTRPTWLPCYNGQDYFDSNGDYVKSSCTYEGPSYAGSLAYCASYGMQLFDIVPTLTPDLGSLLANYIPSGGVQNGSVFWVNGHSSPLCTTFIAYYDGTQVMQPGDCAGINNPICEYIIIRKTE